MKNWKKANKPLLVSFAMLYIFTVSCTETALKIDLPAPKAKLVIHSAITPFTPPVVKSFAVFVSKNASLFDTIKTETITDAKVSLFINGQFDQILKYDLAFGYQTNFFPKPGVEYRIMVEEEGFATVNAKATIPEKVLIKECELLPFAGLDTDKNPFSQLSVTFDDPVAKQNFYEIMVIRDQDETNKFKLYTNDQIVTSESYYPTPMAFDAIQPDRLLFSDKLINGKTHRIDITYTAPLLISGGIKYIPPHATFLLFRTVDEDYYRYYTSLLKQKNAVRPEILFGAEEPSSVFSNIQNGYGVFAGYSEDNRTIQVATIIVK